jgi:hypothetical protein
VGAAARGRALHQLEALRQEHAHKRARLGGGQAVDGATVDAHVLRLAGVEADFDAVGPVGGGEIDHHARDPLAAAPHQLALVGGAG